MEKTFDFKVVLEPDPKGGYVVICASLSGCFSQGDTVQEALENIREAIELCIEDMRAHGEPLPDPRRLQARRQDDIHSGHRKNDTESILAEQRGQ